MPLHPSRTMRAQAARRLVDLVTINRPNPADTVDVDPDTGQPISTTTGVDATLTLVATVSASVHDASHNRTVTPDRTFGVRDLLVWVPIGTAVQAEDRATIIGCRDDTLIAATGTVTSVERKSHRAVQRFTMRLDNDQ